MSIRRSGCFHLAESKRSEHGPRSYEESDASRSITRAKQRPATSAGRDAGSGGRLTVVISRTLTSHPLGPHLSKMMKLGPEKWPDTTGGIRNWKGCTLGSSLTCRERPYRSLKRGFEPTAWTSKSPEFPDTAG